MATKISDNLVLLDMVMPDQDLTEERVILLNFNFFGEHGNMTIRIEDLFNYDLNYKRIEIESEIFDCFVKVIEQKWDSIRNVVLNWMGGAESNPEKTQ